MDEHKPTVYVETTIVSYLTSRPSRDIIILAHQARTRQWWEEERGKYRLFVSPFVLEEAERGDAEAARRRIEALAEVPSLEPHPRIESLAAEVQKAMQIPEKFGGDAFHLAYAIHYQVDYLLTWNCMHMAGARSRKRLAEFARSANLVVPVICTPDEMLYDELEVN